MSQSLPTNLACRVAASVFAASTTAESWRRVIALSVSRVHAETAVKVELASNNGGWTHA